VSTLKLLSGAGAVHAATRGLLLNCMQRERGPHRHDQHTVTAARTLRHTNLCLPETHALQVNLGRNRTVDLTPETHLPLLSRVWQNAACNSTLYRV
jgi:hypothetical protein